MLDGKSPPGGGCTLSRTFSRVSVPFCSRYNLCAMEIKCIFYTYSKCAVLHFIKCVFYTCSALHGTISAYLICRYLYMLTIVKKYAFCRFLVNGC